MLNTIAFIRHSRLSFAARRRQGTRPYDRPVSYIVHAASHLPLSSHFDYVVDVIIRNARSLHRKKYPYIHGYSVASFPFLTEPVQYTFVSVNRRNNEAQSTWVRASLFHRFT